MILLEKILTIGIPTYNRSNYLDKCLAAFYSEITPLANLVNIYVSDNGSTDDTRDVVNKYISMGLNIQYNRHDQNMGTEFNFLSLYEKAATKYFWLFSDDDLVVPGVLSQLLLALNKKEYGAIYLSNAWYNDETILANEYEKLRVQELELKEYDDPIDFIEKVNYWVTFITGTIINKSLLEGHIQPARFNGTMLNYLGWYLQAIFSKQTNLYVNNTCLVCKGNNSGGYQLYTVFGKNFNFVMDTLIKDGVDRRLKSIVNRHLLKSFFPMFIINSNKSFKKETPLKVLIPVYWAYPVFWKSIFPTLLKKQIRNIIAV